MCCSLDLLGAAIVTHQPRGAFWKTRSMIRDGRGASSSRVMLGVNQYGKAETHLVRVTREGAVHSLRDLLVSIALSGSMEAVHVAGDNSAVLPTDTQKNTVYAFAREHGVGTPEAFAEV